MLYGDTTTPYALTQAKWEKIHVNHIRHHYRERNILSRKDLIQLEGTVSKVLGGGTMEIKCDNDVVIRGVLSGRMKKHRIKVMVGDRIQVSVSPYDTTHGLITYRY